MKMLSYESFFFYERKLITVHLPFLCTKKPFSKKLYEKLKSYINDKVRFEVVWTTRKIKPLSRTKDQVKGCVHYISASLFCKSKGEHL